MTAAELSQYGLSGVALMVAVVAWLLTALILKLMLARQVLDIPGHRSSHLTPTPSSGGAGMVLIASATLYWLAASGEHGNRLALTALVTGSLAIAAIGFVDDLRPLSAKLRFAVQLGAATAFLATLEGGPHFSAVELPVPFYLGLPLALVWLLWMTNLYNFMDGIDGLAGIHAMAVGICAALILAMAQAPLALWLAPLLVAAASGGFMAWNFSPAKIFMGDTGSAWLGFVFAGLALLSGVYAADLFWGWVILLGVFVADASMTLLTRLLRGQRIYEAHRSHVYQRVSQRLMAHYQGKGIDAVAARAWAHRLYCLFSLLVIALWLLPLAWLATSHRLDGFLAALIAYVPLAIVALWLKAGIADG